MLRVPEVVEVRERLVTPPESTLSRTTTVIG
jgi:hypothetical protein